MTTPKPEPASDEREHVIDKHRACWCGAVLVCAECLIPSPCIHGTDRIEIVVHKQEN